MKYEVIDGVVKQVLRNAQGDIVVVQEVDPQALADKANFLERQIQERVDQHFTRKVPDGPCKCSKHEQLVYGY